MKTNYFLDGKRKISVWYFLLIMAFTLGIYGCATVKESPKVKKLQMVLYQPQFSQKSYKDPDKDLSSYKTYAFDYTNTNNPLLEKELFKTLDDVLKKRGLKKDIDNPELLITMNFYTGKKETYTPPKTITTTRVEQVWSTGSIGWTLFGAYTPVPITESKTIPGYTSVKHYNNIRLNFLDYAKLRGGEKPKIPPLVYMGEIDGDTDASDIRFVALDMLDRLINGEREIWMYYNDIHFMCTRREDVFVITKIGPDYVKRANVEGLHEGDIIRKIGGVSPSRFVENTIKGLFPYPIRKGEAWRKFGNQGYNIWFDNSEVVLEVECPHQKTIKRY